MPAIDGALPAGGLGVDGLHELRAAAPRDHWAALGLALALIGRRLADARQPALLLWVASEAALHEFGRPYGPGLVRFGIDPSALLLVAAGRARDLAFALEEGIRSRAPAAVLAQIDKAPPLMLRRLALAARASRTPCLLVPRGAARVGPALTRWRVAAAGSAPARHNAAAPGALRWRIALERCRWGTGGQSWTVEWRDDAYRFRLAAAMADPTAEAGEAIELSLASSG